MKHLIHPVNKLNPVSEKYSLFALHQIKPTSGRSRFVSSHTQVDSDDQFGFGTSAVARTGKFQYLTANPNAVNVKPTQGS